MEKMSLYHPSIIKLSNRKFSKMNFNLLISVFGLNQGIKIIKGNFLNRKVVTNKVLTFPSANLILSQEIKEKFEEKNKAFISLTKTILNKIGRKELKANKELGGKTNKRRYQSNSFQRYNNQNSQIKHQQFIIKVIILQKNIRGFLSKKNILKVINNIIIERSIQKIISLQSIFRQYNQLRKTKIALLYQKVLQVRKSKCALIIHLLSSYQKAINEKKKAIIDKLIADRKGKIILIQSIFKKERLMKLVKTIIAYEKNNYVLTYPFYAKRIQIKLYLDTNFGSKPKYTFIIPIAPKYKLYSFEFCRLRQMFVLYIKKEDLVAGKYRCQLIVDGCVTCDGRFPHIECEDGQFYNLIEFNQGKVSPSGETKITDHSDDSKDSLSDRNNKKYSSDEEDKNAYVALKYNLQANPPNCFYNKKWIKNISLDDLNETHEDFFNSINKNK